MNKTKTYPFSAEGLEKVKIDKKLDKVNTVTNIIFYGAIIVLLTKGIIGKNFIIETAVATCTSKTVKWLLY